MEFSRQEYWSGLSCPPSGDLPNPEIEPRSPALQADSLLSEMPGKPKMAPVMLERKKVKVKVKLLSLVPLFGIPWTVVYQASLSMGFSRQEYWSGLPFLSPGDLPNPGIKPGSPTLQADVLPSEPPGFELKASEHLC